MTTKTIKPKKKISAEEVIKPKNYQKEKKSLEKEYANKKMELEYQEKFDPLIIAKKRQLLQKAKDRIKEKIEEMRGLLFRLEVVADSSFHGDRGEARAELKRMMNGILANEARIFKLAEDLRFYHRMEQHRD